MRSFISVILALILVLCFNSSVSRSQENFPRPSSQSPVYRYLQAASAYEFHEDDAGATWIIYWSDGHLHDVPLADSRYLGCTFDDRWWYATILVRFAPDQPSIFLVLDLGDAGVTVGSIVTIDDPSGESISYRVESVTAPGACQMVPYDPR